MLGVGREADKLTPKKVDVETTSEMPREECQTEDDLPIRNWTLFLVDRTAEHCSILEH